MNEDNPSDPFASALQEGERILWQGKPDAEAYFKRRMKKLYILGVLQIAIGIVITGGLYVLWQEMHRKPMPWWLILIFIGLPTIGALICIFVFPAAFRRDAKISCYALTTKRILCFRFDGFAAQSIESLPAITLKMHDEIEGIGSVEFGKLSKSPVSSECVVFDTIPDAQRVYDMIVEVRSKIVCEKS